MQATIKSFFKSETPDPPSSLDDFLDAATANRPQIRITYARRAPDQRERNEMGDGSVRNPPRTPNLAGSSDKQAVSSCGRNLNKKRSYAQLHLDLGQADFVLRTCSVCGLMYAPGDETDEKVHGSFHKNYTLGVPFKGWRNERVVYIAPDDAGRVILVLDDDPPAQRNKVQEVVEMMEIDLGSDWILHKLCKAYLFIYSHRIMGCLLAEPIDGAQKVLSNSESGNSSDSTRTKRNRSMPSALQFGNVSFHREVVKRALSVKTKKELETEFNGAIFCDNEVVPAVCGIRAIWVSPSSRRKHIATHLLDAVRQSFQMGTILEPSQLAYSGPTSAGKALASRYAGTGSFLVYNSSLSN